MRPDLQAVELVAVIVAVPVDSPLVLTLGAPTGVPRLPAGPLQAAHRSLQYGLRSWVQQQTGHQLGYVEQLYTFADRERAGAQDRVVSVSYLGLTRVQGDEPGWRGWYDLLPWEDRRDGRSDAWYSALEPLLNAWAGRAATPEISAARCRRAAMAFGFGTHVWVPDQCLARYELLWEAGLVPESLTGAARRTDAVDRIGGSRMLYDHRRILATGIDRLRAKLQYRPVVFELMPPEFTLGGLQRTVEALAGTTIHKQNFRRLVDQQHLVEETGTRSSDTGGRPAMVYRFRREVLEERQMGGTKLPLPRSR